MASACAAAPSTRCVPSPGYPPQNCCSPEAARPGSRTPTATGCSRWRRCGVADRVRFLGPVARVDVPRLLRSADVVVCPEPYWTTGFGALEGMACGCAVVSAQVSAHTDLVVDQVSGLVVAPRDAAALARGLRTALKGRSRYQALGLAGRNRVEAAYRRAHGVKAMDQALDRARARSAVAG
ncbi:MULTISPECIES: glycosyltransferase [Pseudonocardia]|uniref:glycosyltransferase n=1 Tax=Pseudonocardia TaxID=1847 RepID=UPI0019261F7C